MIQQQKNYLESTKLEQKTRDQEVYKWDDYLKKFVKVRIKITITPENSIIYWYDGVKLRQQLIFDDFRDLEILNNFEQIQYLQWKREYGKSNNKYCKCIAIWYGVILKFIYGYYKDGFKQGQWMMPFNNCSSQSYVCESGEFCNNLKCGRWNYIYKNKIIGGGSYDKKALKIGKWIELSDGFYDGSQVTYKGEYNNGKKVGLWEIWYKNVKGDQKNKFIGGGLYNEGSKQGKWVEIWEGFYDDSCVINSGIYRNNIKVGKWDIMTWIKQIGGGSYDEEGQGIKLGNWVEISDGFNRSSQIIYCGEYLNGRKVGRWDILYQQEFSNDKSKIGGGLYNEGGNGNKQGKWVEIWDKFSVNSEVTYIGVYKNGKKVGNWEIWNCDEGYKITKIGGGLYNESGDESKQGNWVEISEGFGYSAKTTYHGRYKEGQKFGRWDIKYNQKQIGGGSYDEEGQGMKLGNWIEISDGFRSSSQIIYEGRYKDGKKIGIWVEMKRECYSLSEKFKKIKEIEYDYDY
ncbi:unnamed protein product [Paramecium sonneborni]|uniref:MORN repeat protein n=1 Tax=Paramecium sonneborni TaxID=65129 RepID=A0A8S1RFH6_9CILI|nr:unnamed protein product [Paramecium sonneborni]